MNTYCKIFALSFYLALSLSLAGYSSPSESGNLPPVAIISNDPGGEWFYNAGDIVFSMSSSYDPDGGYINYTKWYINGVYQTGGSYGRNMPTCFVLHDEPNSNGCYELGQGISTVTVKLELRDNAGDWSSTTETYTIKVHKGRRYFVKDHLGSVRATVNRDGNVLVYDDYYPFGLTMPGRSSNSANPNDNYKFTGYEQYDEVGLDLYHANARGYDPVIARFLQTDPLAADYPSLSPFVYVANNPLLYIDPSGLSYYYHGSGSYLGESDDDKDDVYVFRETSEVMSIEIGGETIDAKVLKSERLENDNGEAISHDTFLNYGALVYGESSGVRNESYGIANAVVNYTNASNGKYSLSDIVSKKNSYSYAVGGSLYNSFKSNGLNKQNARSVNGAVINALTGGMDYSNGATHWDGTDLGKRGISHYRSRIGFSISQDHANLYFLNTRYSLTSVGANPVYRSTAVRGKTIFWRSHPNNKLNTIYHKYQ